MPDNEIQCICCNKSFTKNFNHGCVNLTSVETRLINSKKSFFFGLVCYAVNLVIKLTLLRLQLFLYTTNLLNLRIKCLNTNKSEFTIEEVITEINKQLY